MSMYGRNSNQLNWNDASTARGYAKLSEKEQLDFKDKVLNVDIREKGYYYTNIVASLASHLSDEEIKIALDNCLAGTGNAYNRMNVSDMFPIFIEVAKRDENLVKEKLKSSSWKQLRKAYLMLNSISVEEEEQGLRGLATSTNCPDQIYTNRYCPRLEALNKLPSVMRLKVLETLLNNNHLGYNIFDKITDEDDFKLLLFSSTMRHRDRVEEVWNKFQSTKSIGTETEISIKGECNNCGPFSLVICSTIISTPKALENTRIGRMVASSWCPLCRRQMDNIASVTGGTNAA